MGEVRGELCRREGKRLYRERVIDNTKDCGKYQVCQSFTECESKYSTIALCGL